MIKTVVFSLLIISLISLHANHIHQAINNHAIQSSTINTNTIKSIETLKISLSNLTQTIKSNISLNFGQLIKQLTNTKDYLQTLTIAQNKFKLKIQKDIETCPGVTTFNRKVITQPIIQIQQTQKRILKIESQCLQCEFIKKNLTNTRNQIKSYIQFINKTLNGEFCDKRAEGQTPVGLVNIQDSLYKSNLKAKNWYYGSTTVSDYKLYLFKRSTLFNLTQCPISTPYAKQNVRQCFNCPQDSAFNLGTKQCQTCKPDEILNLKKGVCQKCQGQKKFIQTEFVCLPCMLSQGKLFNSTSGKCYKCNKKSFLDVNNKKCVQINCPLDRPKFNRQTLQCQACQPGLFADLADPSVCIKTNYIGICPPTTPVYDFNDKSCKSCPSGTIFSIETQKCQIKSTSSHFEKENYPN